MSSSTAQPAARSLTTPPQVKPGPSLMTLVEASSRRRTDTSDATVRTRSATISVGHGASNLSSVSLPLPENSRNSRPRAPSLSVQLRQASSCAVTAMTSPFRPNSPRNSRAPPAPKRAHMQRWRVLVVVVTLAALAAATVLGLVVRTPTTTLTEPVRWAETQNFWQAALAFLPLQGTAIVHTVISSALTAKFKLENHDRRGRISARTKGWLKLSKLAVAQAVLSVLSVVCFYVGEELYLLPDNPNNPFQLESFDSSDQLDRLGRPTRHGYTDPIHRTEKREIRAEKKAKRRERYPSIDTQLSGGDSP